VLLVGSIGLCLVSLNAPARMGEIPREALQAADALEAAVTARDYAALEGCIYGQPDLGLSGSVEEDLAAGVWAQLQDSITFSWKDEAYLEGTAICRDAVVTYVDIAGITDNLPMRAHALLTKRVEEATDMAELYDEGGEFREDLMDQVMAQALQEACREDAKTVAVQTKIQLVYRDGQWWAIPDAALLTALSGGLA
jgi:hypothetical protein